MNRLIAVISLLNPVPKMPLSFPSRLVTATIAVLLPFGAAHAQHVHTAGMQHSASSPAPAAPRVPQRPGQAAFGTIAEIVGILMADSTTDWRTVNIEALRQHLVDMDDVTMRATVVARDVPGGAEFTVTGEGRVTDAIRRMTQAHSAMMASMDSTHTIRTDEIAGGARVTVTAVPATDSAHTQKIRALGFIGFMSLGDHHTVHHLALARGSNPHGGHQH